ncbi:hypothetical protein KC19_2G242000 [Ceratodon purpureus]|uniref:Uncharacterized protein n=1 Tax=Ceratodon purpureus TaxID=3225 RepID=A0A8T0IZX2_CERPU|nr:hypothetical protein KC19_2G242000 [Ceratodon purpureus]
MIECILGPATMMLLGSFVVLQVRSTLKLEEMIEVFQGEQSLTSPWSMFWYACRY